MKISHVLTAVNENETYLKFVPLFVKMWRTFYPSILPVILLIANHIPDYLHAYKEYIVLFPPIKEIHTAYIAQTIRILWPALINTEDGILITDMDMIPGNSSYFTDAVLNISNDHFISLRGGNSNQIYICYNVATPKIWGSIFSIRSVEDVTTFLKRYGKGYDGIHGGRGWETDQRLLYSYVMRHPNRVILKDTQTNFKRLDWDESHDMTQTIFGRYSDYHLCANKSTLTREHLLSLV